jgi:glycosyltransferase involved in cell wall biosynthesis
MNSSTPATELMNDRAARVLSQQRVAVFIVAYNAARHIEKVLRRIPAWVAEGLTEIFLIDDSSHDGTFTVAQKIDWPEPLAPLRIYRTPYNQGYGGNQRLGYLYAIEQQFDIVVLLHGDGQYAPEALPYILASYDTPPEQQPDAVFGSRFLMTGGARQGGMPLYKFVGNRILTTLQNRILGTQMSEMHSGYRSYRTASLERIPFTRNALDFSFDADIIVQMHAAKLKVEEVPIPTFYGDEVCHVDGVKYARQCIKTALKYRLMQFEIFYDPKFDIPSHQQRDNLKSTSKSSLQAYIEKLPTNTEAKILTLTQEDQPTSGTYDTAHAFDVLEHVANPEQTVTKLFQALRSGGTLYLSTPNIAFLPLRIMLALGSFNYSRRGILDLTHRRLFTYYTLCRLLRNAGFHVDSARGFGPPLTTLPQGHTPWFRSLNRLADLLAQWWPTLFAYQFFIQATRLDAPDDLMKQMFPTSLSPTIETEADSINQPVTTAVFHR